MRRATRAARALAAGTAALASLPLGHGDRRPRRRRADGRPKGRRALGAGLGRRVGRHHVRASANFRGRDRRVGRPAAADVPAPADARTVLPDSQTAYLRRDGSEHETVRHARRWVCVQTVSGAGSARRSVAGLPVLAVGRARAENTRAARRTVACRRGGPAIPISCSSAKPASARNFRSREARAGGGQRRSEERVRAAAAGTAAWRNEYTLVKYSFGVLPVSEMGCINQAGPGFWCVVYNRAPESVGQCMALRSRGPHAVCSMRDSLAMLRPVPTPTSSPRRTERGPARTPCHDPSPPASAKKVCASASPPRAVLRRGRVPWRARAPATGPTTGRAHAETSSQP